MTKFIFMLTRQDRTVANALAVYNEVKDCGLEYVGFKDLGVTEAELLELTKQIHFNGQKAALEIVSQTEESELAAVQLGLRLGVDYLLGGRRVNQVSELLKGSAIRYFPFCGNTVGHPTMLLGTVDEIVLDARAVSSQPRVDGLDLLAYRFAGNVERLIAEVCSAVSKPVIVAGSIDCFERVFAVRKLGAWGFTVGSAIFEGGFLQPNATRLQVSSILSSELSSREAH